MLFKCDNIHNELCFSISRCVFPLSGVEIKFKRSFYIKSFLQYDFWFCVCASFEIVCFWTHLRITSSDPLIFFFKFGSHLMFSSSFGVKNNWTVKQIFGRRICFTAEETYLLIYQSHAKCFSHMLPFMCYSHGDCHIHVLALQGNFFKAFDRR